MGVCHRISSPRGGGLVTLTVTNPHLAPPMPVWGVVGHNIDRCITGTADVYILQLISVVTFYTHTVTTIGRNGDTVCAAWYTDCAAVGSAH